MGLRLSGSGLQEDALAATQEAAALYRGLAQTRPDAFLHHLGMSLDNLGAILSDLGCGEDAMAATQRAVGIRRQLAQTRPDAFLPDLAMSLNNVGNQLSMLGRRAEALQAADEACRSLAPFFLEILEAHRDRMATMVGNYVRFAEQVGRQPDSDLLAPIEETLKGLKSNQ